MNSSQDKKLSSAGPPPLDPSLARRLRIVATRFRAFILVEGVTWVVIFLLVGCGVQFGLDYGTRGLEQSMRAALLVLLAGGALVLFLRRIVQPLRISIGHADVACLVERRHPELESILISAVRFAARQTGPPEANSPALMASVIDMAKSRTDGVDFGDAIDPRRARRCAVALAAALALTVGVAAASPEFVKLWFARSILLRNVAWPRHTALFVELENGSVIGARGEDLVIHAYAEGVQPREVEILYRRDSGQRGRETMVTVGSQGAYRYRHTFKSVEEEFVFYIRGGDAITDKYRAILVDRPKVVDATMEIVPPTYTQMPSYIQGNDQRAAKVLPGSEVTISISTNKAIQSAMLMAGDDEVAEPSFDGTRLAVTVAPAATTTYHFALVGEAGLKNVNPARFSVRVTKDDPPHVRMKLAGVGEMITAQARLPIEVGFSDTYGIATAEVTYKITGEGKSAREGTIPLPTFKPRSRTFLAELEWPVAILALMPGDLLTLLARSTDFDTISGPNESTTSPVTLRVVTRDELLAELARREQEYRMDFERLIDSQERLRSNLLTVLGETSQETAADELAVALAPHERRQRGISASLNVIRQQFERIFGEMKINQMDTKDDRTRLSDGIILPLTQLASRELADAAEAIRRWYTDASMESGSKVDPLQATVLSRLRKILAVMLQWEGYHEVVSMLRNIVRIQSELNAETQKAWLEDAGEVFED